MKNEIVDNKEADKLFIEIKELIEQSRNRVYKTVNTEMISLYWNIGKMIVEMQNNKEKAKYGDYLIERVSIKLTEKFGKGFSIQNLRRMRQFYNSYQKRSTLMSKLTWSHYLELIKIKDINKRNFYMNECINSNWDVRELQRQIITLLYERITTSKDKNKTIELSNVGHKLIRYRTFLSGFSIL